MGNYHHKMNWKNIKISRDWTHFLYHEKVLFNRKFISVLKFKGNGLAPVQDENGWFFINPQGETMILGPFKKAWGFYCGLSAVENELGCYHITETGIPTYSRRYSWCGNYQEDKCAVREQKGNYFHIRKDGNRLYETNYRYVGDYKDGLACVMLQNGKFKHIDEKGAFIYENEFLDLGVYHKGYAAARDDEGWVHIDLNGKPLYKKRYEAIEPFYNGFALSKDEGSSGLVGMNGDMKIL